MALTQQQLERQRRYRANNKNALRESQRKYQQKNIERRRIWNRDWIRNNRERYNFSKAKYRLKLKIEVMRLYADPVRCVQCGFSKIDGLVLDHIHNNGAAHRKEARISARNNVVMGGTRIYEHIRKNGKIDGLQVLCANCNTIKQLRHWRRQAIKDPEWLAEIEELYANPPSSQ